MTLTDLPLETLNANLTDALAALHKLLTGAQVAQVGTASGSRVQYTPSQTRELRQYIGDLQAAISAKTNNRPARGPIYLGF
jgi:hypothetical protein